MFGRKKAATEGQVITKVAQEVSGAVPMDVAVVQRMMGEFLASTALSSLRADVGGIARDFQEFKANIARLNAELGEFRDKAIVPVLKELEYLRYNSGARMEDTASAIDKLVHHLQNQLELLLKARGVDPHKRDQAGETPLDRLGVARDRPSLNELATTGVKANEIDQGQTIEALTARVDALMRENADLRRLAVEDGLEGA